LQTERCKPQTNKEDLMRRPIYGITTRSIVMTTVLALGIAIGMLYILVAAA
jgi:hypothetical protein